MAIQREQAQQKLNLEGRLEGIDPPELIHKICLPGRTGTLSFTRGELCKTVYINNGRLIFATSNNAEDRLGETLLRAGMIGYRQYEEASVLVGCGKRLGAILVERGSLSPENLVRGVLEQVKDIILDLFTWERGSFRFSEGALPSPEVITLNISTPRIIFEGVHRIRAWPRIAEGVGSPRTVYRLTREGRRIAEDLDLGAAEGLILEMLEEPVSVAEICRGVFLPNFEVYQALWAFRILGIVREVVQAGDAIQLEIASPSDLTPARKGRLEDVTLGPLLLRLCRQGETGILYLGREGEERALHLRSGTIVFATSNRPEDNLTSFLLRHGVIGLRDRDEVERRLLSNKRAGTILREMGILSQDELVRFVRDQLREIILAAFKWEEGEWRFVDGDLPTLEGITLDRPVEEWVLHGVKRVKNWTRIRQECGDLETVLRPVESPSAALGGVELSAEEGEVLAAVQVPRSIGGVCESVRFSHYRVCQVLWAFQMIGAIVRVPTAETIGAPGEPRWKPGTTPPNAAGPDAREPEKDAPGAVPQPARESEARPREAPPSTLAEMVTGSGTGSSGEPSPVVEEGPEHAPSGVTIAGDPAADPFVENANGSANASPEDPIVAATSGTIADQGPMIWSQEPVGDGLADPPAQTASASVDASLPPAVPAESAPVDAIEPSRWPPEPFEDRPDDPPAQHESAAEYASPAAYASPAPAEVAAETDPAEASEPLRWPPETVEDRPADPPAPTESAEAYTHPAPTGVAAWSAPAEAIEPVRWPPETVEDRPADPPAPNESAEAYADPSPAGVAAWSAPEEPIEPVRWGTETVEDRPADPPAQPEERAAEESGLSSRETAEEPVRAPEPDASSESVSRRGIFRDRSLESGSQRSADGHELRTAIGRPMPPDAARRVGMLKEIERFNMHHHEIYAVFKGALGARAKNTVVNIIKKVDGAILVFAALAPDDAGHFPAGELYERLKDQPREEGRRRLDSLLLAEGRFLEQFLDRRGTERLSALLAKISGGAKDNVTEEVEAEKVGPTR